MSLSVDQRDHIARVILVIFSTTGKESPLRQGVLFGILGEYTKSFDEDAKWCFYCMLEDGIMRTGWICERVGVEMERLVEMGDNLMKGLWERISEGEINGGGIDESSCCKDPEI